MMKTLQAGEEDVMRPENLGLFSSKCKIHLVLLIFLVNFFFGKMGFFFSSVEVFYFFLFFCEKNIFQIFHFKKLGKNKPLVMDLHKLWLGAGCSYPLKLHMSSMPGPPEPSQQIPAEWKLDKLRTSQQ